MSRATRISMNRPARPRTRAARLGFAIVLAANAASILTACASSATAPAASHEGTWGDSASDRSPYLELDDDGTLTGTDGCNRLAGTWKATGNDIAFGEFASTRMACDGVDTWLAKAVSAKVTDSTMIVIGADGSEAGSLERTA